MKSLLSVLKRKFAPSDPDAAIKANPRDISAWVRLIDTHALSGSLSPHAMALVKSHGLHPTGHAVHAFAADIAAKGGPLNV